MLTQFFVRFRRDLTATEAAFPRPESLRPKSGSHDASGDGLVSAEIRHGNLQIAVLHLQDVLVMKLFAGRTQDMKDIAALQPTPSELDFVRSEVPRLGRLDASRATRLESIAR